MARASSCLLSLLTFSLSILSSQAAPASSGLAPRLVYDPNNDYSCRSSLHPNPVILIHGFFSSYIDDLDQIGRYLKNLNYCTFALTYGEYDLFPLVGGLKSVNISSPEIATFIRYVQQETGAPKVDLIGHSEGATMSLHVPKFEDGISEMVDKIVALAPTTHGTSLDHIYDLAYVGGNLTREVVNEIFETVGCGACTEFQNGGSEVAKLNDGPIAQPGNKVTIIMTRDDKVVVPYQNSIVDESGVSNIYVQDFCPDDSVGHAGLAWDETVWNMVVNVLNETPDRKFNCSKGLPA